MFSLKHWRKRKKHFYCGNKGYTITEIFAFQFQKKIMYTCGHESMFIVHEFWGTKYGGCLQSCLKWEALKAFAKGPQ